SLYFAYSIQTPKSTVLVTTICSLLSIAMLVLVVFVFVKEHEEIMKITRTKKNALCLWSLIGIGISSVIEILLALSTLSAVLRYMDIVERLKIYQQILDLQQRHPNVALGVLTTWSSAEVSKDGSMDFNRFHERNVDMEIQAAERDMADAYEQYMDEQVDLQNQVSYRL
ncbi:unnamed protein product, partial [Oikopleura dioica]